ncbi:uncharacterized protein LOC110177956 isoform X2 [Drosophila serrata]|uniref:uncharacterized protein LOC110177956 isoform X2 n=1 Tax=Drosophila serrata TaxID=7274 RepID=UPI000A1D19FE|nr:uncharacterized protein LOC110177956 isoform X2 [Drosophila serrata]
MMRKVTRRGTMVTDENIPNESEKQSLEGSFSSVNRSPCLSQENITRTYLLLLDYKQFKATQTIQRTWRRFHRRCQFLSRTKAAITIQRWWRGFLARNKQVSFVENMLQDRVVRHYHKSATKIQALFRGWRIRQTVHDNSRLRKMQVCAAEDLLNCVAFKLHHLLRTYSIPGVYSLRNSNCLSRVEKLLASLHFRFRNGRIKSQIVCADGQRGEELDSRRSHCQQKVQATHTQYWSQCKSHCYDYLRVYKDMDRRMYRIIEMYDAAQKKAALLMKNKPYKMLLEKVKKTGEKNKHDFCGDVIESMRRWNFLVEKKIKVDKNVFKNPEVLEKFLTEISELAQEYDNCSCYCHIPVFDEIYCG